MHIVFFSTSDVFSGEEILIDAGISYKVVPTPVTDKAYCGVCLKTNSEKVVELLKNFEFKIVE
ncbi:DUF3343 domain-containing protein [[Clostridium] fimetarium]|uniref:Putative Se/S carrier protein-like domain-containing protein n=1 Tax=[Clostridium] fimetarium TaxID=99656 RepID=A0A1I0NFA9_9FIRM|nr:DUF3343 domain-containing protein [[Clostridium] fimetarium]SEV99858.1 Protein of unknown function [[Clostridium] fimetarium]